ncbi:MAG: hypothetical protein GF334_00785 [Candidatus Altiarchaeales archaeon]|nr:hypothetical protein [Candidatus Altiarchaeales archaeon]
MIASAEKVHLKTVKALVAKGGLREATLCAFGVNAHHGIGPEDSEEDRRFAVSSFVRDPRGAIWDDKRISERFGVPVTVVTQIRSEEANH